MMIQGHHHHHHCECLLTGWKDEGEGMRGKGDDNERWYVCFILFLVSIYLSSVFLGSKLLLMTGC